MDRVALKTKAKKLIEGKKWYLWKPLVIFELICFLVCLCILIPVGIATDVKGSVFSGTTNALSSIISVVESVFMFGYAKYCLKFVRGKEEDWKEPFKFSAKNFIPAFVIDFLMGFNIIIGFVLLIIPGIMASLGLSFVQEVYADDQKLTVTEVLRKSWDITNGHKMDLFVLGLSFFGWFLLVGLTCGILMIWLMPYITITYMLAYEELRKKK